MEELLSKHRKEARDLQSQITGMKKQATKSTRKEVNSKCQNLQDALKIRHEQEIKELEGSPEGDEQEEVTPEQLLEQLGLSDRHEPQQLPQQAQGAVGEPRKGRRNRQKEKLAKREAEIARIKEEARLEALEQPDLKKIEQDAIDQLCAVNLLQPYDIIPDGHCLFASIRDQLEVRHGASELDIYKLRALACEYIRQHQEDFVPYMFDEETMQLKDVAAYTEEMEKTAKWGGELEILALSKQFDCPISVMMSGRAKHVVNESGNGPELKLVYYKHTYALGEHYNSLHDI